MKKLLPNYQFSLLLLLVLTGSCQSQKTPFAFSGSTAELAHATDISPDKNLTASIAFEPSEIVGKPAEKALYSSQEIIPAQTAKSPKAHRSISTYTSVAAHEKRPESKTVPVIRKKQDEPEKVRGRWLSGGFLAAGMALLLVALVMIIAGASGAGTIALIGGGTFLAGFIFTMLALLGR